MAEPTPTGLTRREMLQVGGATFAGYALAADTVLAQVIKTDTDGLAAGDFQVKIGDYSMPVYEARPASGSNHPIILVVSEIWGVHEWVKDCTRRFAKQGYYAVAPELFQREGGVGHIPDIQAIVAWYGPPARPYPDQPNPVTGFDVAKDIKSPFLGLYGETDQSPAPADARKLGDLLKQHNQNVEIVTYPGAGHGFFADYRPSYNATAAADAWKRCLAHFDKSLKA